MSAYPIFESKLNNIKWVVAGALALIITLTFSACQLLSITPASEKQLDGTGFSNIDTVSVKVGHQARNFALSDADGNIQTLAEQTVNSNVLLLFYRGDWCPFCQDQLNSIKSALPELQANGVQVIAISPDDISVVASTAKKFGSEIIFLSDQNNLVSTQYGIDRDDKLPHPAIFLIDRDGYVKWLYVNASYRQRPTGDQLISITNKHFNQ